METGATDEWPAALDEVIRQRRTIREYQGRSVSRDLLFEVLDLARLAPSTFNTQPWKVHVLTGEAKQGLTDAILQAHSTGSVPPFSPFPGTQPPEVAARQSEFGRLYYGALGIRRDDMVARNRQTGRNFAFFGAPVGLIFTIDTSLAKHSWLDFGIFLQNLMLAAHVRGLSSCPQVSFVRYQSVIAAQLGLSADEEVVCGMSLGYADTEAPVNQIEMPRESVDAFTSWLGFSE